MFKLKFASFGFPAQLILAMVFINFFGCVSGPTLKEGAGYINLKEGKVWYRIQGSGDKTPLLLLHGGPGFPSYYLNPLGAISAERPVIFLDQLGCGRSDRISDTSLMTVDKAVEWLESIRSTLGIEKFHMLGHSWGTMLGMDYYLKYPEHVASIIFGSPALSADRWARDADTLLLTLPDSLLMDIRKSEAEQAYTDSAYLNGVDYYYKKFVSRKLPWGPDIDSSLEGFGVNVYEHMWGPSEFTPTGNLRNYDRTKELSGIKVPTLFTAGEFDEARLPTMLYYQQLVPGAKLEIIKDAAHLTMQDQPEENIRVIKAFLDSVE